MKLTNADMPSPASFFFSMTMNVFWSSYFGWHLEPPAMASTASEHGRATARMTAARLKARITQICCQS